MIRCGNKEKSVGEWKTIFDDDIEGRPVEIKVYEAQGETEDEYKAVRVTTIFKGDESKLRQNEEGRRTLSSGPAAAGNAITLEPDTLNNLEEELVEIGFSPDAAAQIASKVSK
jgi:hypothetical protein